MENFSTLPYGLKAVFLRRQEMHCEFSRICLHNMEKGCDNNLQIFLGPKHWLQVKDYYLCKAFKKKEQQNPICLLSKHQQSASTVQDVNDH